MASTNKGFTYVGRLSGGPQTVREYYAKDTETLTKGDILNMETGELDLAVTSDAELVGVCMETQACVDSTTLVKVCVDRDAIYSVYDANARVVGATLDISGTTGAQTVAASSNAEFVCVDTVTASEPTYVVINVAKGMALPFA